jgi:steroid delta-isomerase-like uncharacterized protein
VSLKEANEALVRRYYDEMWNRWDLSIAEDILAPDVRFRGSLGTATVDIRGFCRYARSVWLGFPDFTNQITEMIAESNVVTARLTFTGTHRGDVLGIGATGRTISYEGIAWFRIEGGLLAEISVFADREGLLAQIT